MVTSPFAIAAIAIIVAVIPAQADGWEEISLDDLFGTDPTHGEAHQVRLG